MSQRFGKREPGEAFAKNPKRMLSRVGKRSSEHVSRVLGRLSKRNSESRVLGRLSKRNSESRVLGRLSKRQSGTRILGRMTKRGKFANMRWRRRAEDEAPGGSLKSGSFEPLPGSWPGEERRALEDPVEMIHLGKHWMNLALDWDKGPPHLNAWGRVSKRTNNNEGRRFSRIGMVKREAEMGKRSGVSGRFIRIGIVGEEQNGAHTLRIVKKRSGGDSNDQSSRWIRIGVNNEHEDWGSFSGRISKKAEGKVWNPNVDNVFQSLPLDSDLLTESDYGGGAAMDEVWEDEDEEDEEEEDEEDDEEEVGEEDEHAESLEEGVAEID